MARRGQVYTWTTNERPRLSLAGAQDKCPLLVRDSTYWLPRKESPSSHILKFELSDYRHLPAYETFTTLLAEAIGLPGQIARLHQEDFCQALGFGHEHKYQEYGGPTFADCYRLIQDVSSDPANDLQHLLRWQIFNVLAGNSDGHAKNLSLLYRPGGEIRLAPFYDLVCTRAIERIDYHLAFSIGNERNPGVVATKHWDDLAQQCGLRPRFLQDQVQDVAKRLLEQLQPVKKHFQSRYGPCNGSSRSSPNSVNAHSILNGSMYWEYANSPYQGY